MTQDRLESLANANLAFTFQTELRSCPPSLGLLGPSEPSVAMARPPSFRNHSDHPLAEGSEAPTANIVDFRKHWKRWGLASMRGFPLNEGGWRPADKEQAVPDHTL
eukprot:4609314-Alexandrium_andersonii.AAC.1